MTYFLWIPITESHTTAPHLFIFEYVMLCGEARTPPWRSREAAGEQEGEAQSHSAERTEQRLQRAYGSIAGLPHPLLLLLTLLLPSTGHKATCSPVLQFI